MANVELLFVYAAGIALSLSRLRFLLLTRWHCHACGRTQLDCDCKPAWVKILL